MRLSRPVLIAASLIALASLAGFMAIPHAEAFCSPMNSNSRPSHIPGYGAACAYTGGGCRECTFFGSTGYSVCAFAPDGSFICTDFQDYQ